MKCRPDKGKRYPECDAKHPEMVLELWRFLRKNGYYDPYGKPPCQVRYWPTELAVEGMGFVNLANALEAAEQAKASIFDSNTGRLIPYESVETGLIMFEHKFVKLVNAARKTEANGLEFWNNLS